MLRYSVELTQMKILIFKVQEPKLVEWPKAVLVGSPKHFLYHSSKLIRPTEKQMLLKI